MHPLVLGVLAQQHIEDLQRSVARQALAKELEKRKTERRRVPLVRLQRAPAH